MSLLHHLLHGYDSGHGRIAGSVQLDDNDEEVVARLSDLSGATESADAFQPYLTTYPLPSGRFNAFARTWPDAETKRPGCVVTHTILVPTNNWAQIGDFTALLGHFGERPSRSRLAKFEAPSPIPSTEFASALSHLDLADLEPFIQRFFLDGIRPIIWLAANDVDRLICTILSLSWPSLRADISACGMMLQERTVSDRPFDVMFVRPSELVHFAKYPSKHYARRTELPAEQKRLVHRFMASLQSKPELYRNLDRAPHSARRVLRYLELAEQAQTTPLAALGALDLLGDLGAAHAFAGQSRELIRRALAATRPNDLESFVLLAQRIEAEGFTEFDAEVVDRLQKSTRGNEAHRAIEAIETVCERTGKLPSVIGRGLASTLETNPTTAMMESIKLTSHLAPMLARQCSIKTVVRAFESTGIDASNELGRWAHESRDFRSLLTSSVAAIASTKYVTLLEYVLSHQDESDWATLLAEMWGTEVEAPVGRLLADSVGDTHWGSIVHLAHTSRAGSAGAWFIAGATGENLDDLLALPVGPRIQALSLCLWIQRIFARGPPSWLRHELSSKTRVWQILLDACDNETVASVLDFLEDRIDSPALPPASLDHFSRAAACGRGLQRKLGAAALMEFTRSGDSESNLSELLDVVWFREELIANPRAVLDATTASSDWGSAWRLLELVSSRGIAPPLECFSRLTLNSPNSWPDWVAGSWIRTINSIPIESSRVSISAFALDFALRSRRATLDELAGASFFTAHQAALVFRERYIWDILGIFDWDKGLDLRRRLVETFHDASSWSPHYFVVAASEPWLLRKLASRMLRQSRGYQFLERSHGVARSKGVSRVLLDELDSILQRPKYEEDWD